MSWLPAAIPVQHPVAISTASAAADIFNIANQSTAVFMTLCTREKDCCTKQLSLCYYKAVQSSSQFHHEEILLTVL